MPWVYMTYVKRSKEDQERVESRVRAHLCLNKFIIDDPKSPKGKREVQCDSKDYRNGVCRSCDIKQMDQVYREQSLTPAEFVEYESELIKKGLRCERTEVKKIRSGTNVSVSRSIVRKVSRRAV